MKGQGRWRYWLVISLFSAAAAALFVLSVVTKLPDPLPKLTQAIGEALAVAVVVSLAVEPRLLRFFGEEIASQTFWSSFYSRAPDSYREAIKALASAERFGIHTQWQLTFDWADPCMRSGRVGGARWSVITVACSATRKAPRHEARRLALRKALARCTTPARRPVPRRVAASSRACPSWSNPRRSCRPRSVRW